MTKPITKKELTTRAQKIIYTEDYSAKPSIEGVKIIPLTNYIGEDGDFATIARVNEQGFVDQLPNFAVKQINHTMQLPGSVKAWHAHLGQDEVWFVPPSSHLLVGLWDIRKDSKTANMTMRFALGGGSTKALFIPRGVAHGSANVTKSPALIIYFVNQTFDLHHPDEHRLPWDAQGADFWQPERD